MKLVDTLPATTFSARRFTRKQLARVQETVARFPKLSRTELARTLCEHLCWTTPNGKYKIESCLTLLEGLEAQGVVTLPAKQVRKAPQRRIPTFENNPPDSPIGDALSAVWRAIVARHQRIRPNRSYPRRSMRPETKWHPSKEKKRDQKAALSPVLA
jgi:hypothetical protein